MLVAYRIGRSWKMEENRKNSRDGTSGAQMKGHLWKDA